MIIGIDATRANKPQKTGVEWYTFFLIKELIQQAPDVTFRLYFNTDPEPALQNLGPNVEYRQLRWPFKYLWTQIRLSFEMLWHQPDVLFIPASIIPFISARRTVTTIHDVAFEAYKDHLSQKSRLYLRLSVYWAKWFCSKIITVSHFSKEEIIKYYQIEPKKIEVAYLGLNWPVINKIMSEPKRLDVEPFFLFVSRLEKKKNIAQLIEVFAGVQRTDWGKNFKLILAGYPSRGWSEAEEKIRRYNLENNIVVKGWINEEEKFTLMRDATALFHLAKYEGFGFSPLEAMACGTPAVVNNATCLPEVCGGAAQLVDAENVPEAVEGIRQIIQDEIVRKRLIERGQEHCRQFTWQATARETLNVLKSVYDNH